MSSPTAMITGAARGIGQACAVALARQGFDIVAADVLDTGETAAAVRELGRQALGVSCDVTSDADRRAAVDAARGTFGRLDALVNNAGVAPKAREDILAASEESFDFVISVNLKGPYFLTQLVANWMIEQKKQRPNDFLSITNISSISAYTASPSRGEYCVSKAGVSMMTRLFAARLADEGIPVFEIRPGIIQTDMTRGVQAKYDKLIAEGITPIRRWGLPEDIGRAVAACAAGSLPFSTGQVINVDGGFHLRIL